MSQPTSSSPAAVGGLRVKSLVIIGGLTAGLWALAIYSGSLVFRIIMGVLSAALVAAGIYVMRLLKRQKHLTGLLEGATSSPEARRAALARLAAEKDPNDVTNIIARAQLEAADDPKAALVRLESIERKRIPVQLQDDFGLLLAQLYLNFGRAADARPLVDKINVDNPQRAAQRGLMVAVVAEAMARTKGQVEALKLLDSVDLNAADNEQVRIPLLVAKTFAHFAASKKGLVREDLKAIAAVDVNMLGRFVMPQFRVHPELQRLAREIAQGSPQLRRQASRRPGAGRRFG